MAVIEKALQIAHRSKVYPGKYVNFAATPYEGQTVSIGAHNPANPSGFSWDNCPSAPYGFLSAQPPGVLEFGYVKEYGDLRPDMRLLSAKFNGSGWTFTHEARSKSLNYSGIRGNRSLRTEIYEARDNGDSAWYCYSGGHVASSIILPNGVTSRIGLNGENIITIQSATPDAFLARLSLPQMPYVLAGPANKERFAQWFLAANGYLPDTFPLPNPLPNDTTRKAAIQNVLGKAISDTYTYVDPFGGLGTWRNQNTTPVGELMTPAPANDLHFLNKLSSSRALVEWMTNHVLANGKSIGNTFSMEILTGADLESDLLHFEVSGNLNSMIDEAAKHGVWRWWWDAKSAFHFVPDYYSGGGGGKIAITLSDGPSMIGEVEVGLANGDPVLHSQAVRGQPFSSFGDATSDPLSDYYNKPLGAIYPPGAVVGDGPGADEVFDSYMGKNAAAQAQRMFAKANARTTLTWSNFPYPALAFGLPGREIRCNMKDPKGAWDFTGGDGKGKRFVVESVSIDLKNSDSPGGGEYMCSATAIEI